MPKCKGCGAEIEWIKTQGGRNMPLDVKPLKVYVVPVLEGGPWEFRDAHMPHWATCPNAKNFKRKRGIINDGL